MPPKIRYAAGSDGVARVEIDRPEALNALDSEAKVQLADAWQRAAADGDVRVVLLSGAGPRAFCAGSDMKEIAAAGRSVSTEVLARALPGAVAPFEKPVIAAVRGYCLGMGLTLASHCDIRIADEQATFGFPEVRHGMISGISAVRIPQMIGRGSALLLLLGGETVTAAEALRLGLVDRVVAGDVVEAARELAALIASYPPAAVRATKRLASLELAGSIARHLAEIDRARDEIDEGRGRG